MKSNLSRRQFMGNASAGLVAATAGFPDSLQSSGDNRLQRLPREVWIGSVSLMGLTATDAKEMVEKALNLMQLMVPFNPDIICLPESFAFSHLKQSFQVRDVAEKVPGPVVTPFLNFAKTHRCYVICPTYSRAGDNIYIAAILIDRSGKVIGQYNKIRPTDGEIESGVRPGQLDPPVFDTDFGKIGIQICFDIKWDD